MNYKEREILLSIVKPFYSSDGRFFHDFKHILSARSFFDEMNDEQYVAWLFHDIIYDPKSYKNEEESEILFRQIAKQEKLDIDIKLTSTIILDTKIHTPTIPESELVLDIDMLCLSLPYDQFVTLRELVIQEFTPVFGFEKTKQGVKDFLKTLIGKKIYTTKKFEERNVIAQENIIRYTK